jgi:hypothetical protein
VRARPNHVEPGQIRVRAKSHLVRPVVRGRVAMLQQPSVTPMGDEECGYGVPCMTPSLALKMLSHTPTELNENFQAWKMPRIRGF